VLACHAADEAVEPGVDDHVAQHGGARRRPRRHSRAELAPGIAIFAAAAGVSTKAGTPSCRSVFLDEGGAMIAPLDSDLEGRIQDMAKPTKLNPAFEAAVRRMLAPQPQPKPAAKTKEKAKKGARK
jgi:hypothetical protein